MPGGLRKIVVRGLFGSRNYEIPVARGGPTVLTGANGTGKSTLLRLVNAVSTGDMRTLLSAPLDSLELTFDEAPRFRLLRGPANETIVDWGDYTEDFPPLDELEELPDWAAAAVEESERANIDLHDVLAEAAQAEGLSYREFREVSERIGGDDPGLFSVEKPDWFDELGNAFPVLFITDQRLVVEPPSSRSPGAPRRTRRRLAVEAASVDIMRQMRRVDSDYARVSQEQDRRFPRDVISAMSQSEVAPPAELEKLSTAVDERRRSLRSVGLLDPESEFESYLAAEGWEQERVRPVIATFLRSTLTKLEVLENLSARLQFFQTFLNDRFSGKSLRLNRRDGVRFELDSGPTIRPADLSSGEQQMTILAYEILFRAREGTLVILDEPEISLHVLWQDALIENLAGMGAASGLQFLLATHSPVLLASHPELERSLDRDSFSGPVSPT